MDGPHERMKAPGTVQERERMKLPRKKIMIVDDEESILRSTHMLLNVLGYDSVPVSDVGKIIEVAAHERPDLILQDIKMPSLDVDRLMAALRKNPATASIPLAFFSASPQVSETAAAHRAPGYLTKPFAEDELIKLLERLVPATRVTQQDVKL